MMITHFGKQAMYVFLALVLLLQACTPLTSVQSTPEPLTLRVVLQPYLSFAPFFIAEEEGYFAEQGLQIEFVKLSRSAEAISALAQGELDVVGGSLNVGSLNSMARGSEIKFVADKGYLAPTGCAYQAILVRRVLAEGGKLDKPAQLQGLRVSLNPTGFSGYYVETLLNTTSLTLDDVEIIDLSAVVEFEALEEGSIDAITTSEPWVTRILLAGHGVIWIPVQNVVPNSHFALLWYGSTLLQENPDAGRRFMLAYLKGVQQYNQGKTERNLEILAENTGLDQELLKQACWPFIREDGQINVQSVLDFQAWAVEKGYLDSPVTEEQFWDPSFVDYANQVLDSSTP